MSHHYHESLSDRREREERLRVAFAHLNDSALDIACDDAAEQRDTIEATLACLEKERDKAAAIEAEMTAEALRRHREKR